MIHAFTNLAAFLTPLGLAIEPRGLPIYWYLVPLPPSSPAWTWPSSSCLVRRQDGVRSFVEWQLHGIWTTFIVFSALAAVLLYVAPASPRLSAAAGPDQRHRLRHDGGRVLPPLPAVCRAVHGGGARRPVPARGAVAALRRGLVGRPVHPGLSMHREYRRRLHDESRASTSRPAGQPRRGGPRRARRLPPPRPLSAAETTRLLPADDALPASTAALAAAGLLEAAADRYAYSHGREYLDGVLEGIERQLTPDAPAYERRTAGDLRRCRSTPARPGPRRWR